MICRSLVECLLVDIQRYEKRITIWAIIRRSFVEARVLAVVYYAPLAISCSSAFFWRFALLVKRLNEIFTGFECHNSAMVGEGLFIAHSQNIVIGEGVCVGMDVTLYNGITLGAKVRNSDGPTSPYPVLEDNVTVYSGAKLLGPIVIGKGAIIGANAVVLHNVPPGHFAVGVPARVFPPKPFR